MKKIAIIFCLIFNFQINLFAQGFTNRQVFDFNIGDVFQRSKTDYYSSYNALTYLEDSITSKTFSVHADTLIYSMIHKDYEFSQYGSSNTKTKIFLGVTNLDSFSYPHGITKCGSFQFTNSTTDSIKYFSDGNLCNDSTFKFYGKDWGEGFTNAFLHKGLGDADYYYSDGNCQTIETSNVIFYKKGSNSCGTRYAIPDVGIDNFFEQKNVTNFPNPTNSSFTINFSNDLNNASIKVFNLTGQMIFEKQDQSGKQFSVDLSNQSSGIYFVEVQTAKGINRSKVVKE